MTRHAASFPVESGRPVGSNGFTLIEVLVAMVILGLTFSAILGGMATSINTSDHHRQQSEVQAVLASAVERLKSPSTALVPCATKDTASYKTAVQGAAPTGDSNNRAWTNPAASIQVKLVEYSNPDGGFGSTCYDTDAYLVGGKRLLTSQRITIEVIHPDGRASDTMTFVKGVG